MNALIILVIVVKKGLYKQKLKPRLHKIIYGYRILIPSM
jgi:hypothetical protein